MKRVMIALWLAVFIGSPLVQAEEVTQADLLKRIEKLESDSALKKGHEALLKKELQHTVKTFSDEQTNLLKIQTNRVNSLNDRVAFSHDKINWLIASTIAVITFLFGVLIGRSDIASGVAKIRENIVSDAITRAKDTVVSDINHNISTTKQSLVSLIDEKTKEISFKENAKILVVSEEDKHGLVDLFQTELSDDQVESKQLVQVFDGHDSPTDSGYDLVILDNIEETTVINYLNQGKQPAYLLHRPHNAGHYVNLPDSPHLIGNSKMTIFFHALTVLRFNDAKRSS